LAFQPHASPTSEHYFPLLYVLGVTEETDAIYFVYEGIQNASISMRCVQVGSFMVDIKIDSTHQKMPLR
jgi:aromatic ring-opening dioxygenase catalytic subunit (LigB family)